MMSYNFIINNFNMRHCKAASAHVVDLSSERETFLFFLQEVYNNPRTGIPCRLGSGNTLVYYMVEQLY